MIEVQNLSLKNVFLLRPTLYPDARGHFFELFRKTDYRALGIEEQFVQDNCSVSKQGVIRGMHYQKNPGQAKLVTVLSCEILDVVVDVRTSSPTFGKWEGVKLTGKGHEQLYIPQGFAHGFCVLSKEATVFYKVSSYFDPLEEITFRFDDPEIGIDWPVSSPLISEKDRQASSFSEVVSC